MIKVVSAQFHCLLNIDLDQAFERVKHTGERESRLAIRRIPTIHQKLNSYNASLSNAFMRSALLSDE